MPNIGSLLKNEIARVARKELRGEIQQLKKSVAQYRSQIAQLKRRMQALEQQVKRQALSAASVAKILGVSALSVYKWESGKTRPRARQLEAIASLRKMGKRDALARLEA